MCLSGHSRSFCGSSAQTTSSWRSVVKFCGRGQVLEMKIGPRSSPQASCSGTLYARLCIKFLYSLPVTLPLRSRFLSSASSSFRARRSVNGMRPPTACLFHQPLCPTSMRPAVEMQVQSDHNFDFVIQYIATFCTALPNKEEMKVRCRSWNLRKKASSPVRARTRCLVCACACLAGRPHLGFRDLFLEPLQDAP